MDTAFTDRFQKFAIQFLQEKIAENATTMHPNHLVRHANMVREVSETRGSRGMKYTRWDREPGGKRDLWLEVAENYFAAIRNGSKG